MSTLSRQSVSTTFNASPYPAGAARIPARSPAPPATAAPRPVPSVHPRQRVQTATLVVLVLIALVIVSGGIVYLSGYAQMTGEKYRTIKLQRELKQAHEMQRRMKQLEAIACAPASIENKARTLGMIPAADKDMVTVGEPVAAPPLEQVTQ